MDTVSIVIIAFGLAMDAFAVSVASGTTVKRYEIKSAFRIALFFGGFQGIMPVIGWAAGQHFKTFIMGIDHWVAFCLLVAIGCKMIYRSSKLTLDEKKSPSLTVPVLTILAVATSIDALAVGLSMSFLGVSIARPAIIIGLVTFLLSFLGVFIGKRVGHFFERKIAMIGGIILIGIGLKILFGHLS